MSSVVVSLDAELSWGFHDFDELPEERLRNARASWRRLVDLFDEFDIPATWGVVGHLFLESCDGIHADHPASTDWFTRDPGGTYVDHPDWFAPDLVELVRTAKVGHEIGCHTFSHVEFGRQDTSAELAAAELETSQALAADRGLSLTSLTFPRNNVGHRDVLATHGFTCYRGVAPLRWFEKVRARRPAKLLDFALGLTAPPVVHPTVDEYGLVDVPASFELFCFEGTARAAVESVVGDPVVRQCRRGIDAAIDHDGIFHIWLHPNDLTTDADFGRLRAILSYVNERRADSDLVVQTMGDVAAETLSATERPSDPARPTV